MSAPLPSASPRASAPEPRCAPPTLGDLIAAVDEAAGGSDETVRVVDHLLRSGRVRRARVPERR